MSNSHQPAFTDQELVTVYLLGRLATSSMNLLRESVHVAIVSWEKGMRGPSGLIGSVASVEKEIVSLASGLPDNSLLNVDGI
jgi:hypothetical protein